MKTDTETQTVRRALVVEYRAPGEPDDDTPRDPAEELPGRSLVLEMGPPDEPDQYWAVRHGPVTWPAWDACDAFGVPGPDLAAVRLETDPDGDTVDVVAPVMDGDWLLRVTYRRSGPELVPKAIELRPRAGAKVGARALRKLGFGAVHKAAAAVLLNHPEFARYLGERWTEPVPHPGRAGRRDWFYAYWAARYVEALEASPRRPVAHLIGEAKRNGEHLTRGEVLARISEARRRGLMTEAQHGRAGGELTDKARDVLAVGAEG